MENTHSGKQKGIVTRGLPKFKTLIVVAVAFVVLSFVILFAFRLASGGNLDFKSTISSPLRSAQSAVLTVLDSSRVSSYNHGKFTNVIFLHHSVGQNIVEQGELGAKFAAAGLDLTDHGYNDDGLTAPNGQQLGYGYRVPGDSTDPDGLARVFAQPALPLPVNTFSALLQYEVIILKSCFTTSDIKSDGELADLREYYFTIRSRADQYPDKIFILMTTPPLNPAESNLQEATRARAIAQWLKSSEYTAGHPNLFVFDLFDYLAERDPAAPDYNMLARAYRDGSDSHPNRTANQMIAPILTDFVSQAVQQYRLLQSALIRR